MRPRTPQLPGPGMSRCGNLCPQCITTLVTETEGRLPAFSAILAEMLLLGGSKSPAYLKTTLDALAGILPKARHIEFAGCGHLAPDNSGQPERVARELRAFFAAG